MADSDLQRTVRRCTALLVVPLALLVLLAECRLDLAGVGDSAVGLLARLVALALLAGAVAYLGWSAFDEVVPETQ